MPRWAGDGRSDPVESVKSDMEYSLRMPLPIRRSTASSQARSISSEKRWYAQPCQRVKPVEQGDDKYRGLNQIIPAAQMDLFMEENIFPFFLP